MRSILINMAIGSFILLTIQATILVGLYAQMDWAFYVSDLL